MKKINKLVLSIALVFLCETASAKDFWDRAWDVAQAVGTEVLKNEVNGNRGQPSNSVIKVQTLIKRHVFSQAIHHQPFIAVFLR